MAIGTIVKWKRDNDGNPDVNPTAIVLDSRIYEVEFSDGKVLEYVANVIAENLYSQVDKEGHHQVVDIVDHKGTDTAMTKSEGDLLYVTVNGTRKHRRIITTKGWKLVCILWKDGTTSWEPLSDLKEAYPIQTADE
jgi:hypothetical protein